MKTTAILLTWVFLLFSNNNEIVLEDHAHTTEHYLKSSTISWTGSDATGAYKPTGTLKHRYGSFRHNHGFLVDGVIVIDMTSLETENAEMQAHLKNEDFFHTEKFPQAKFKMTSAKLENGTGILKGLMTIKDTTIAVAADAQFLRKERGYQVIATLTLDRTDFGITYNSASYFKKLKDKAIADEFSVNLDLYFE